MSLELSDEKIWGKNYQLKVDVGRIICRQDLCQELSADKICGRNKSILALIFYSPTDELTDNLEHWSWNFQLEK